MMGYFGGYGISGFFMLFFWLLIIVAIVVAIKWLMSHSQSGERANSALDILRERYAKGEIDKKEFEEKKGALSK